MSNQSRDLILVLSLKPKPGVDFHLYDRRIEKNDMTS